MTDTVTLPSLPKDKEFEDYVAACLQSSGYIERNIIDRGEEDVLELDIITTSYTSAEPPSETLIEVKSGNWGFGELFKLKGWGEYLKISKIQLVVCNKKGNQKYYETKAEDIGGVLLTYHSNNAKSLEGSQIDGCNMIDPIDIATWRFSYWVERTLLKKLTNKKKSLKAHKSYHALDNYFHIVNSGIFFEKNIIRRTATIYSAYQKYPHISAKVGNELEGKDFDEDHRDIPKSIFDATFYKAQFTDVNISTYIEYKARLALLKAAVDFSLYEKHGFEERVKSEIEFLGLKLSLKDRLPSTFLDGLDKIKTHSHFEKYPVFWQHFLWLFGGFLLDDYQESDYCLLSLKTGVPIGEIDNALKAFDLLFPTNGGWFKKGNGNSKITYLKMFSVPFMGIGAHYRKLIYGGDKEFDDLSVGGLHTKDDLVRWNNLVVDLLKK